MIWESSALRKAARPIGLLLFIAVGGLYLLSGLLAPVWAVALLWALWLMLLVALVRVWRDRPWLVVAIAVVGYVVWAGVLLAGEFLLDWSA